MSWTERVQGKWIVQWEYTDDFGHVTGPWESVEAACRHMAYVAELLIQAPYHGHVLKSVTLSDEN